MQILEFIENVSSANQNDENLIVKCKSSTNLYQKYNYYIQCFLTFHIISKSN